MRRIAIVGVGHVEPPSASIELAKAALQNEGLLIVSATDIDSEDLEAKVREEALQLPKGEVYKLHALPLLDEPYIPKRMDSKPFYYNVPKRKKGRR